MRFLQTTGNSALDRELEEIRRLASRPVAATSAGAAAAPSTTLTLQSQVIVQSVDGLFVQQVAGVMFNTADGFTLTSNGSFAVVDRAACVTVPTAIAAASNAGVSLLAANADHTHAGVHKITFNADALGDIVFAGSAVSQSGNTFTFTAGGSVPYSVTNYSSGATISSPTAPSVYVLDMSVNAYAVTLPSAVGAGVYPLIFKIRNTGSPHTLTISPVSAQTIDGASSATLSTSNSVLRIISDGANWQTI